MNIETMREIERAARNGRYIIHNGFAYGMIWNNVKNAWAIVKARLEAGKLEDWKPTGDYYL